MPSRQSPIYFTMVHATYTLLLLHSICLPFPSFSALHRDAKIDRVRTVSGKWSFPCAFEDALADVPYISPHLSTFLVLATASCPCGWTRRPVATALRYLDPAEYLTDLPTCYIVVICQSSSPADKLYIDTCEVTIIIEYS
jgi:hypothetical protein